MLVSFLSNFASSYPHICDLASYSTKATCSFASPLASSCICESVFQEFKNVDGEEYHADMSTLASPASQGSPDVYILPLTEVSLPVAKQPARSGESLQFNLLNSTN